MNLIKWWKICRQQGHYYLFDGNTLGGICIRCSDCNKLEEFLPGVHEPKGGEVVWQNEIKLGLKS